VSESITEGTIKRKNIKAGRKDLDENLARNFADSVWLSRVDLIWWDVFFLCFDLDLDWIGWIGNGLADRKFKAETKSSAEMFIFKY
jgi:hypothetical protein